MSKPYDLYQKFDYTKHKETFINYCEVIVDKEGHIYYATPSHTIFAEVMYAVKHKLLPEELLHPANVGGRMRSDAGMLVAEHQKKRGMNPYYYSENILDDLGIVMVWYKSYRHTRELTDEQLDVLRKLVVTGNCSPNLNKLNY